MKNKLLLLYLFVVLIPISVIGYLLVYQTKKTLSAQTTEINMVTLHQLKMNITSRLETYINLSNVIFSDRKFKRDLELDYSSDEYFMDYWDNIDKYPSKFIMMNPNRFRIFIHTTNSTLLKEFIDYTFEHRYEFINLIDEDTKKEKWYKDIIKANTGSVISVPYRNRDGKMAFSIGRLLKPAGETDDIYMLLIEILEDELASQIKEEGRNKDIYLLNEKGYIMTSSVKEAVGMHQSNVSVLEGIGEETGPVFRQGRYYFIENLDGPSLINQWKVLTVVSPDVLLEDMARMIDFIILVCAMSALVAFLMITLFSRTLTRRLTLLVRSMKSIRDDKLDIDMEITGRDEIDELTGSFKEMLTRIRLLISEVYIANMHIKDLEIRKRDAELNALQSQVNPHFLFNTMESLRMNLIKKGETEVSDIIGHFAQLMRKNIEWGDDMITFRDEIALVRNYIKIQKFRYRDKLDCRIEINPELMDCMLPKFTIQPIVENAIYHGIETKDGKGTVVLSAAMEDEDILITVRDDGEGIDRADLEHINTLLSHGRGEDYRGRIGILNVHERIRLYFGGRYGVSIDSEKKAGTVVKILLPLKKHNGSGNDVQNSYSG